MKRHILSALLLASLAPLTAQTMQLATPIGNTTLAPSNPPSGANSYFFDLTVTSPGGILVSQIDVNVTLGGVGSLDVYVTSVGGTFLPNISLPAAWTLVGTAPMASLGNGVWSPGPMTAPFFLAPGTYGVCLHHVGMQCRYTNPGTGPTLYSDANLSLDCSLGRVRNSTPTNAFTGGTGPNPRVHSMRWTYTTNAQVVDFGATPTRGATPLTVQFSDRSFSGLPGGIVAYAWDFDGDSIVDSTLQNPTHTYNTCGDWSPTLTIVDTSGPYSITKTNLIQTDVLVTDFTTTMPAANTLQFTDTTQPAPQSWAWDLDGDSLVDSTLPNPVFVYPAAMACNEVIVTLTVQRACRAPVVLTRRVAVAENMTTRFDGGTFTTTGATGGTNFFDVNVTAPQGIVICAMHVHSSAAASTPIGINVWSTPGTYVNNHQNAAVWRLIGTGNGTSVGGVGGRTFVPMAQPIYLAPGSHGIAVEHVGASPFYINVGGNQTFTNADLSLTAGLTQTTDLIGNPIFSPTATVFSPRIWNGALYYTKCSVVADAGYTFFAPGCAGSNGVPGNVVANPPRIGTTMSATLTNLPSGFSAAFYLLGFSRTNSLFGPLPLDLTGFGAPGCHARVSADSSTLLLGAGSATFNLALPNNPALLCTQFYAQGMSLDPVNALGAVMTDAAAGIIGR